MLACGKLRCRPLNLVHTGVVSSLHRFRSFPTAQARIAVALLVASLAIWLLSVLFRIDLNKAVALATVGSTVIALVAIWMTSGQAPAAADGVESQTRAAYDLVHAVRSQWQREVSAMGIQLPGPLLVRWSLSELAQGPNVVSAPGRRPAGQPPSLTGDVTELSAAYRSLPSRHLVILGPAGSGKTVLALLTILQLAADWKAGETVPVFLSAASWNPEAEQFSVWVTRSLMEDYPALGNTSRYGDDAAGRLVAAGRLLLVLDGLDELPGRIRSAALAALDNVTRAGQELILSCRTEEYRALEAARGYPPLGCSVVELVAVGYCRGQPLPVLRKAGGRPPLAPGNRAGATGTAGHARPGLVVPRWSTWLASPTGPRQTLPT